MKCPSCGAEFTNNETFCTSCGARLDGTNQTPTGIAQNESTPATSQQPNNVNTKTNGLAIGGFVLSLVAFAIATILLAPISAILSSVALTQVQKSGEKGKGLAIAGIVISIAGIVIVIIGYATGMIKN